MFGWEDRIHPHGIAIAFLGRDSSNVLQESLVGTGCIATFQQRYLNLISSKWPSLRPSEGRFEEYAEFVRDLAVGLDDFSDEVLFGNDAFLVQLDRLHAQLVFVADGDKAGRRLLTANLVLDLLLSACLVPAASLLGPPEKHDTDLHFDYTAEISRHWIQGLPPELLVEVIKELRLGCASEKGLDHSILLCSLQFDKYESMSVAQRICHLSLANFSPSFRRRLLASALVSDVVQERDQLGLWMLSCSNCDEQYWLNTCEVGARNIMMACRMPTIAHCIEFTREVVSHLRLNRVRNLSTVTPWTFSLWNMCCRSKSLREFCEEILLKVDLELDRLEERVRAVLKAQNKHKELQLLTQDWNKTTQFLSCIFYPEEPVVLSKKLISNHWQLSAKLIALPCILGSFLPGEPFVMKRNEGTCGQYDPMTTSIAWRDSLAPQSYPQFKDISSTMKSMSDEVAMSLVLQLWSLALDYGGLLFASKERIFGVIVGHLNCLFAIKQSGNKKAFLVGDPEIRLFKLCSLQETKNMITNDKVSFDLFDV